VAVGPTRADRQADERSFSRIAGTPFDAAPHIAFLYPRPARFNGDRLRW
jgi:hypothetical protein